MLGLAVLDDLCTCRRDNARVANSQIWEAQRISENRCTELGVGGIEHASEAREAGRWCAVVHGFSHPSQTCPVGVIRAGARADELTCLPDVMVKWTKSLGRW